MTERSLIIIGGGGHTRALVGVLKANGVSAQGIVTRDEKLLGIEIHGVPVLGIEEDYALDAAKHVVLNGVGNRPHRKGSGLDVRADVYRRYGEAGFSIAGLISQQAILMPEVALGTGVQVMPGSIIQAGVVLNENCIVNSGAVIEHDSVIERHAHIGPGAVLCGGVSIGERTHVGAGAVIIQGIRIGSEAVIGAGAVVRKDVPAKAVIDK